MSSSLPSSDPDAVTTLTAMGFPKSKAIVALLRADNDVNRAVELLSTGLPDEDDAEFDLIAAAQTLPDVRPATIFHPRSDHEGAIDPFVDVTHGTVSEMIDSRISIFTEMGFSPEEAEKALQKSNNDVNEALSTLLSSK